jgi:hypothetical protein
MIETILPCLYGLTKLWRSGRARKAARAPKRKNEVRQKSLGADTGALSTQNSR